MCILTCCSGILSARTFRMSVSVERERVANEDGLMIDDIELELLENRIESAAATRAPLSRLPLLPVASRPEARRRPVLASIVLWKRRRSRRRRKREKSPLSLF